MSDREPRREGAAEPQPAPSTQPPTQPDPPPTVADRADYDPAFDPGAPISCEVCGAEMYYNASCKLRCPRCGYTRDCSDP